MKIFQITEIALKKVLGIRKVQEGQIFDSSGFVRDSHEKITRYVLYLLPLFQKIQMLVSVSKFNNNALAKNYAFMGGGE